MKASQYIWMNGQLVPWEQATIHVMTHGMQYGTSVFEGIRCYQTGRGPAIFRLQAHIRRLLDSAKMYRMVVPFTYEELVDACRQTISQNGLTAAYIRPIVYRGVGTIAVDPQDKCAIEVAVAAFEMGAYLGSQAIENGIDACVSSWHRLTSSSNPVLSKAGGHYTNAYLIAAEARANGFGEGIVINADGQIAEAAASNCFLVRGDRIFTPPLSAGILGGITRDSVLQLARDLGYAVSEEPLPREMLYVCDELFLTGTASEITPVRSVDRLPVGEGRPGPVTRALQAAFFGLFDGRTPDRHGWLDRVNS